MAIKITTDNMVKTFRPSNGMTFNIDELNDQVDGWIEPFKIGPVWVMYKEKAKDKGYPQNELASFFFDVALYGEVLVVPSQQLPSDWSDDEVQNGITADMVDSGFLLSLQNSLALKKMREANLGLEVTPEEFFNAQFAVPNPREEYLYEPPTLEHIDENTEDFLTKVYDYISRNPLQFTKGVILDEGNVIIRTSKADLEKVLTLLTRLYIETEEYEKCAVIKHLQEKL
jgi:hypothetical protein